MGFRFKRQIFQDGDRLGNVRYKAKGSERKRRLKRLKEDETGVKTQPLWR